MTEARKLQLWLFALLLLAVAFIFGVPRSINDPDKFLYFNISAKTPIWEPIRRIRIHWAERMGANPNSHYIGDFHFTRAVIRADEYYVSRNIDAITDNVLEDARLASCEIGRHSRARKSIAAIIATKYGRSADQLCLGLPGVNSD